MHPAFEGLIVTRQSTIFPYEAGACQQLRDPVEERLLESHNVKRIEVGDKVVITEVGEYDSYYVARDEIVGREAVVTFACESIFSGWQSFEAYVDGLAPRLTPRLFFIMVKTQLNRTPNGTPSR